MIESSSGPELFSAGSCFRSTSTSTSLRVGSPHNELLALMGLAIYFGEDGGIFLVFSHV